MSTHDVAAPQPSDSGSTEPVSRPEPARGLSRRRLLASAGAVGAGALVATATRLEPMGTAAQSVELTIDVPASIQNEAKTGKPAEGKFGAWSEVEVYSTHVQKFDDENPDISVKVNWYEGTPAEKVLAMKTAGNLGDIVHGLGVPFDVAARNEIYRPLDDLIQSTGFDLSQYFPNAIDFLRIDPKTGKRGAGQPLYALPTQVGAGSVVLFYNADLFAKKGVNPPTSDMSWDSLLETAKAMTERKEGEDVADVYGWLVSPFWFGPVYFSWLRDFGADIFDETGTKATLNTPEAKACYTFLYDAIYTHKVSPRPDILTAVGQYKNMFAQQKLAMFRLPPWGVLATSDLPLEGEEGYFKWGATLMPAGPSGQRGSSLDVSFIGMNPESKNPEAALKLLGWVTNKDAGVLQCFNAGQCTPRPDVLADGRVSASRYLSVVNPSIENAKPPRHAANGRDTEAISAMGTELDKLLNDQVKPDDDFFENMNKAVQDVLDQPPS